MKVAEHLREKSCKPCHAGTEPIPRSEAEAMLAGLAGWKLTDGGRAIRREWRVKNFVEGIRFFERVTNLAEAEDHHPDLHLEGYRQVAVCLTTHAIRGLSENDFILAAKIDELPVALKDG